MVGDLRSTAAWITANPDNGFKNAQLYLRVSDWLKSNDLFIHSRKTIVVCYALSHYPIRYADSLLQWTSEHVEGAISGNITLLDLVAL